mmetsp:Transcript_13771/g.19733  ORF Transcript_13771/g.19733 Transcript_13771/m.19733 type:complete len:264 (-) Transcript_13771:44-835(-)|eukprot:CAMPEP_0172429358 /NCGR_PEP_ID=MMETSP1064-20121228/50047_1 /TAXON_ID=202472 /ORGANISM="Aulacoseira subarctica , Strain CCAP 1002/5" /LENGTH=263 /DNA_ID=CAMNT_0013174713 /DNA_START=229 /DNA_END=1020 /DNA_ORIENTATION=+
MVAHAIPRGRTIFSKLRYMMEHYPVTTNSILSLHLWFAGDLSAQYAEHYKVKRLQEKRLQENEIQSHSTRSNIKGSSDSSTQAHADRELKLQSPTATFTIDYIRTIKCASYGALVTGPVLAVWYPYLDRTCQYYKISSRYGVWGAPVFKVIADEFIMDPPFISMFFAYMNVCEGGNMATLKDKLRSEFLNTWLTSLAVWPVIMLATFRYLPVHAAAPVANAFSVAWDGFLSHRNAVARDKDRERKTAVASDEKKNITGSLMPL